MLEIKNNKHVVKHHMLSLEQKVQYLPSLTAEICCFAQVQIKHLFGCTPMASANHHGNPSTLIRAIRKKNPTQNRRTSVILPQIAIAFGGFLLVIREILWCDGWILG